MEVYYNLHLSLFSIKSIDVRNKDKGKVVAYSQYVTLNDCEFRVSRSGLLRVRRERKKCVCAVVRGKFVGTEVLDPTKMTSIYFNPYTTDEFVVRESRLPIKRARMVFFFNKECAGVGLDIN